VHDFQVIIWLMLTAMFWASEVSRTTVQHYYYEVGT